MSSWLNHLSESWQRNKERANHRWFLQPTGTSTDSVEQKTDDHTIQDGDEDDEGEVEYYYEDEEVDDGEEELDWRTAHVHADWRHLKDVKEPPHTPEEEEKRAAELAHRREEMRHLIRHHNHNNLHSHRSGLTGHLHSYEH